MEQPLTASKRAQGTKDLGGVPEAPSQEATPGLNWRREAQRGGQSKRVPACQGGHAGPLGGGETKVRYMARVQGTRPCGHLRRSCLDFETEEEPACT